MRRQVRKWGSAALALAAGCLPAVAAAPAVVMITPGESLSHAVALAAAAQRWPGLKIAPGATAASDAPKLTGGAVVTNTVEIGNPFSLPAVSFSYQVGKAGLAGAQFTFTSPNGGQSETLQYSAGVYSRKGTIVFQLAGQLSLNSQPGAWTLTSADLFDYAGNVSSYDAATLAKRFSTNYYTVYNHGNIDYTPPTLSGGILVTPTVSLSSRFPAVKMDLSGSDAGSGLDLAYVFVSPPGQSFAFAGLAPLPLPIHHGSLPANTYLAGNATGTWTIFGYALCDLASNCVQSLKASDVQALFGTTTFTVTN